MTPTEQFLTLWGFLAVGVVLFVWWGER